MARSRGKSQKSKWKDLLGKSMKRLRGLWAKRNAWWALAAAGGIVAGSAAYSNWILETADQRALQNDPAHAIESAMEALERDFYASMPEPVQVCPPGRDGICVRTYYDPNPFSWRGGRNLGRTIASLGGSPAQNAYYHFIPPATDGNAQADADTTARSNPRPSPTR